MQRIPTLYGFSIIVLVLVLMIVNHIIYMKILEDSMNESHTHYPVRSGVVERAPATEVNEVNEVEESPEVEVD